MSYNPTTWHTGDIVSASKLNNIEQGIITLDTAINEAAQSGGVVIDDTLTQTGAAADSKRTGDEIASLKAGLADVPNRTVKSAEQLISDKRTTDKVPYKYRASQSGKSDKAYDCIVGGTVCFNQLEKDIKDTYTLNGVTLTKTDSASGTITGTATANSSLQLSDKVIPIAKDHVYLVPIIDGFTGTNKNKVTVSGFSLSGYNGGVFKSPQDYSGLYIRIDFYSGCVFNVTNYKHQLFDLTAMFGTTIADHIYSLEQATAGAGIALFRAMFADDYYAYNAGELVSVEGLSAKEVVGFNLFDDEVEFGRIAPSTGEPQIGSGIRSKKFIPIIPSETYYFTRGAYQNSNASIIMYYDSDKNYISWYNLSAVSRAFVPPVNARFIKWQVQTAQDVTTYNHDICISLSNPLKNGQYEPYHKTVYPLDSTLTLRGVPVLKDGKVEFDGDTYASDGTVTRRYGIVDLGTLDWTKSSSGNKFYATISPNYLMSTNLLWISERYATDGMATSAGGYYGDDKTIRYYYVSTPIATTPRELYIHDEAYTTAESFKASLSGVMLVYELETPTTEEATPYTNPQVVSPYGTEEYISETACPVGHITEYPDNLRAKIDGLPWDLSMIAPVETAYKATRNYTVGNLLIVDNTLYKVTANIANNGTITPNSNVVATTLSEVISALA